MLEKILHGGNFAAISALLSAHSVLKKDKSLRPMALQMGQEFEAALTASPLPDGSKKLIPQLMQKYPITEADIAAGLLDPAPVAKIVRDRIEADSAAQDPALRNATLIAAYEAILTQMLTPVLAAPDGMEPMQWAINRQLLAQSAITGATKRMFEEGITEKAVIGLARSIAVEVEDVGQAWLELQNAMDIAVRVQAEGQSQSNHGDFVDTVLARVAELARDGDYTTASARIDDALQEAYWTR